MNQSAYTPKPIESRDIYHRPGQDSLSAEKEKGRLGEKDSSGGSKSKAHFFTNLTSVNIATAFARARITADTINNRPPHLKGAPMSPSQLPRMNLRDIPDAHDPRAHFESSQASRPYGTNYNSNMNNDGVRPIRDITNRGQTNPYSSHNYGHTAQSGYQGMDIDSGPGYEHRDTGSAMPDGFLRERDWKNLQSGVPSWLKKAQDKRPNDLMQVSPPRGIMDTPSNALGRSAMGGAASAPSFDPLMDNLMKTSHPPRDTAAAVAAARRFADEALADNDYLAGTTASRGNYRNINNNESTLRRGISTNANENDPYSRVEPARANVNGGVTTSNFPAANSGMPPRTGNTLSRNPSARSAATATGRGGSVIGRGGSTVGRGGSTVGRGGATAARGGRGGGAAARGGGAAEFIKRMRQQQQQQQHLANQNAQLASPNGMQAANSGQQGHPTPVQAAAQGPNTLWRGTLVWESMPSNNIKHESFCQIAAFALQGINYTAQELNLGEWPEQLRVKLMVEANVGFVESCVRSGIQMVRIGPSPNADQDTLKYFEDFSSKMREKSYYALANAGTTKPMFPFAGIILTYFRNHLVGLPFFHRQITEAVMHLLQQHTLPGNAVHHQQPGGNGNASAQQMTSQPVVSGMSAPGTINATTAAAIIARNASLASAAQQTAAQQIMSPQQSLAVRPNLSSPGVASPIPNHLQGFANLLQSRLSHEQMEAIWNLPTAQRDATITLLLNQAINARQIPSQLQAQLAMQQQQQQQQMAQLQQASHNQQLAQLLANQQLMQQQHMMGNMSGLNPAMFSAAGQQGGMTAFSSQPPNSQQLMPSQLIQQQQQQIQQQQHRPS
ncbi:hypothetical protein GGI19_002234 [Coemansia pectinata]|uniref:Uncharacterized protein n=1 Tax=Coemansia pectinata TaxID=1052879 RepID=A0A9W8H2P9_9FUNG|nr:hypothetical protein GGI19_002234 [Coemansia pectinata]